MERNKNKDSCYGSCLMYVKGVCSEYKGWGKKGMYGVNELIMDTHEHLVNLRVNINYFHFKI